MNTGMQDAFNLAWKLALVVKGVGGDKLLESYSPERSAVGDQVLKAAGRLTTIGTLKNPIARGVRDVVSHFMLGLNAVKEKVADDMSEVSIGYPESPLNGPSERGAKGANPGERVAPVSGQTAFGAGDTPRFALCADAVDVDNEALDDFRDVLDTERRPAISAGVMTLVRPDGYIACSARSARDIARYLAALRPS